MYLHGVFRDSTKDPQSSNLWQLRFLTQVLQSQVPTNALQTTGYELLGGNDVFFFRAKMVGSHFELLKASMILFGISILKKHIQQRVCPNHSHAVLVSANWVVLIRNKTLLSNQTPIQFQNDPTWFSPRKAMFQPFFMAPRWVQTRLFRRNEM